MNGVIFIKKERIALYDNLKFILILLVVTGHFIGYFFHSSNYIKIIWTYIYTFHMPAFIFISGLFSKNTIKEKNLKKVSEFFILYIALQIYTLLFNIIFHFAFNAKIPTINLFDVGGFQWFILSIFFFYIITILLNKLNKKYLLIISIIFACCIGYDRNFNSFLCLSRTFVFYPFFLAGYIIDIQKITKFVKNNKIRVLSVLYLILTIILFYLFIDKIFPYKALLTAQTPFSNLPGFKSLGGLVRLAYYGVNALFIISLLSITPKNKNIFTNLGGRSLSVYMFHRPLVTLFIYLFNKPNSIIYQTNYLILFPVAFILTIILSQKFFEKIINFIKNIRYE